MSEEEIIKEIIFMAKWFPKLNLIKERQTILGLLDLYNKEKEKNASLQKEIKLMKSININDNYIYKDKIRERIKELEGQEDWYIENKSLDDLYGRIDELKELLKEE